MQRRRLGNSDLEISPIGIGAWAMGGGDWAFAWGPQEDIDSVAAIHAGVAAGMNWIDTAAVYGLGHAEEVVGRAVKAMVDKPYVFTKCGRTWDTDGKVGRSLKPWSIRRECEDSLRRLQVDCIDLYQIHWPQPPEDLDVAWETMAALQREGKVRWIGGSNFSVDDTQRCRVVAPITSLQPPYNMLRREIEADLLPLAHEHGIGVLAYSPMASGLLSGAMTRQRIHRMPPDDWRRNSHAFQSPQLERNLALVEVLREIGAPHGRTPGEVAIAWTLRRPEVTAAIVGLRNASQVPGVAGAAEFRLSEAELARVEAALAS